MVESCGRLASTTYALGALQQRRCSFAWNGVARARLPRALRSQADRRSPLVQVSSVWRLGSRRWSSTSSGLVTTRPLLVQVAGSNARRRRCASRVARSAGGATPRRRFSIAQQQRISAPRSCRGVMDFDPVLTTMRQPHAGNSAAAVLLLFDTTLPEIDRDRPGRPGRGRRQALTTAPRPGRLSRAGGRARGPSPRCATPASRSPRTRSPSGSSRGC